MRWYGRSALVALLVSWNLSVCVAAERIAVWADEDGVDAEGVVDLTGANLLSLASQSDADEVAWDGGDDYEYAPAWTIWAGAIFLQRDNPQQLPLAQQGVTAILDANDLNFGTAAGPDINAIRHGEAFDVGMRYFHVYNMSAHTRIFPPGAFDLNLGTPYNILTPQLDGLGNTSIQSIEINLRKNLTPNLTVLAGFRYIALRDNLGLKFDVNADDLLSLRSFGINRLYGAQCGVDANVWTRGRFQFQSAIKVGVYGNSAKNQLRERILNELDLSIGTSALPTSFVGDWNFTGVYQLNDVWAIRGGYQLLWLSGVALASEQFPLVDVLNPGVQIHTNGNIFLHGALVSLQAGW